MAAITSPFPPIDLDKTFAVRPASRVGLLLSRQPRLFQPGSPWLRAAVAALRLIAQRGASALAGSGHAAWEFVHWYAHRLRVPLFIFEGDRPEELVRSADLFISLSVRPNGLMMNLARSALAAGKTVRSLPAAIMDEFLEPAFTGCDGGARASPIPAIEDKNEPATVKLPRSCRDDLAGYLWHYTRARAGPWPGQSRATWFETLCQGRSDAAHTAENALKRILAENRLRAGGALVRGGATVVCLSAQPPAVMRNFRRFRCWLGRWDYEPWAIGVSRECARNLGARPVRYLPSSAFETLAPDERWLFQKHEPPETDWSHEEEWRILKDVDLSRLSPADWVVYHHPP